MKADISDINPVNIHFQTQASEVRDRIRSGVVCEELDPPPPYGDNFEGKDTPASFFTSGSRTKVDRPITYAPRPVDRVLQKHELDELNSALEDYKNLKPPRKKEVIDLVKQEVARQRGSFNDLIDKIKNDGYSLSNLNLILGATRAGKSTLLNFLNGYPMIVKEAEGRTVLDVDEERLSPQQRGIYAHIGHRYGSETTIPNFAKSPSSDLVYVDCAGEFDTNILQSVINSYFKADLTKLAKYVKLTLVVPASHLEPSGSSNFRQVLQEIGKFIGDWDTFIKSQSMSLVITQADPKSTKQEFLAKIGELVSQVNDLGRFKDILQDVCKRKAIGVFHSPDKLTAQLKEKEITQALKMKNRGMPIEEIQEYCSNLSKEEIESGKINTSNTYLPSNNPKSLSSELEETTKFLVNTEEQELFSMGVQPKVQEVMEAIAHDLTNSLNNKVEKLTTETILDKFIDKLSTGSDTELTKYITACKESNSISNLFKNLSIEHSSELEELQQDLSNFSKLSRAQASSDSFHHLQTAIVKQLVEAKNVYDTLYIEGTKIKRDGSILRAEGFAPKISQVLLTLSDSSKPDLNKNITSIEVVGVYKVEIDVDLPKDKMSGRNLSIIANIWEITGERTIDLSGLDCDYQYSQAALGQDGSPGRPGKSGGHFFGYGNHFIGKGNLGICSNGGKGGDGQQGGKGIDGDNQSGNTEVRTGFGSDNIDPYTQDDNYYDNWNTGRVATFKSKYHHSAWNLHRLVFRPTPPTPNHGGNGSNGGAAGRGGLAGKIELIGYQGQSASTVITTTAENGHVGIAGIGGAGGAGGQIPVYEVDYLYRTPGGWQATFAFGGSNFARMHYWIENRHVNTFYGRSGSAGSKGGNFYGISDPETIDQIKLTSVVNHAKEKLESLTARRELGVLEKLVTNFQESLSTNEKLQENLNKLYSPELQKYTRLENPKILKIISSYI
jgi:energy-coupling factor transporter ATP-binding protein EcfA2